MSDISPIMEGAMRYFVVREDLLRHAVGCGVPAKELYGVYAGRHLCVYRTGGLSPLIEMWEEYPASPAVADGVYTYKFCYRLHPDLILCPWHPD